MFANTHKTITVITAVRKEKFDNLQIRIMAIIHCGFVPHQNKSINLTAGFRRNYPADDSTPKS